MSAPRLRLGRLEELAMPLAVWKAVEGDRTDLIALLRSDQNLSRWTREALAEWLEGNLQPVKLPRGRPRRSVVDDDAYQVILYAYYGHDPRTKLGSAGYVYEVFRRYIRKKNWHLKRAGRHYWSAERLREAVAKRQGINLDKLINYLNRTRKPQKPSMPWPAQGIEVYRQQLAFKIHRTKNRKR